MCECQTRDGERAVYLSPDVVFDDAFKLSLTARPNAAVAYASPTAHDPYPPNSSVVSSDHLSVS